MTSFPRYALYYTPAPDSALASLGAGLLGYDAFSGSDRPFPADVSAALPDWHDLTRDPRKYGFHATLKAPFALASDATEAALLAACEQFAGSYVTPSQPLPLIRPVTRALGSFIAMVPDAPSPALQALAARCVETFDRFRAPLTATDRARRNPDALSAQQVAYLDRWGYPYVFDEFRFHMTLTGRVPAERRDAVLAVLRAQTATQTDADLAIDRLAVFRQDSAAERFRVLAHYPLT
ncbi:DUF1045 domain-containing protein [Bradyrhizobium sp. U87765 SZCCT0131]|uniref:DUF1045 domain-containing protein n=1 Tax=unclassified Bradyrhizobium TaxID=2631580 RepID=UPI001BAD5F1A|nr:MULTISPECIES: DUF1045 domain-containing protein [unclassified Bradyrhizobium]MBR1217534.1 DUF1045 domain-containing protein [Bradyrhizobium sp. U87765 SZCCT0131]MBR1264868.1 DUF1045 domain-containing protein [Bradyrhizobium sp. U87765 SZCCT0134]MBR1304850.1 DUF1045 domain-containing protein [Bradyrhizobium sp. U87765 SZCCT0110]MBR1320637.1 DUF1045 domain-containing protein [Bradyrhizobium sp. U87765 SZCCT0109]MBR1349057.1 DUF1045 domain-containing protein [Bradyrhizobium sp. U87765 SZCCT004